MEVRRDQDVDQVTVHFRQVQVQLNNSDIMRKKEKMRMQPKKKFLLLMHFEIETGELIAKKGTQNVVLITDEQLIFNE